MLLTEPLKVEPGNKNIRTWIMVRRLTLYILFNNIISRVFDTISPLLFLHDCRHPLPSPWCGLWVAAVIQTAERSLVSSSE